MAIIFATSANISAEPVLFSKGIKKQFPKIDVADFLPSWADRLRFSHYRPTTSPCVTDMRQIKMIL